VPEFYWILPEFPTNQNLWGCAFTFSSPAPTGCSVYLLNGFEDIRDCLGHQKFSCLLCSLCKTGPIFHTFLTFCELMIWGDFVVIFRKMA